jgi:hypothetical protein
MRTAQHCVPFSPFRTISPMPDILRFAWAGSRVRPAHLTVGEFGFLMFFGFISKFLVGFLF